LVIGRSHHLDDAEMQRLTWRSDKVSVNQKKILCMTFDQLLGLFDTRIEVLAAVEKFGADKALANLAAAATNSEAPAKPPPDTVS